LPTERIIPLK